MSRAGPGGAAGAGPAPEGAAREALKERSATALERALAFVEAHGRDDEHVRALALLQARPASDALDALAQSQEQSGSFRGLGPVLAESLGAESVAAHGEPLAATLAALVAMADLRALDSAPARAAEAWLRAAQAADGSWGRPDVPPEERLFVTGLAGGLLGRMRSARPAVLEGAGSFLGGLWSPEQVEGARWSRVQAFACFFTNVAHDASDEALQWCGRELTRALAARRCEALCAARVLLDCEAAALPAFSVMPWELLDALLGEQAADGGFAELAPGGPGARTGPTLDGLRALLALNAAF